MHNLAQYVHSLAQGKIGSGFDVSAAVYGSQVYKRFDVNCLGNLLENGDDKKVSVANLLLSRAFFCADALSLSPDNFSITLDGPLTISQLILDFLFLLRLSYPFLPPTAHVTPPRRRRRRFEHSFDGRQSTRMEESLAGRERKSMERVESE